SLSRSLPDSVSLPDLHSFPTRRSSDLGTRQARQSRCSRSCSRSSTARGVTEELKSLRDARDLRLATIKAVRDLMNSAGTVAVERSEEHTSELQSPYDLVCRLLLEKKKT